MLQPSMAMPLTTSLSPVATTGSKQDITHSGKVYKNGHQTVNPTSRQWPQLNSLLRRPQFEAEILFYLLQLLTQPFKHREK